MIQTSLSILLPSWPRLTRLCLWCILGCLAVSLPAEGTNGKKKIPPAETLWKRAKRLYEEQKDELPSKVTDAAKEDFEKMGDWEYLVIELKEKNPELLTGFLNEAGSERWECFFISPQGEATLYYFKRREVSYIEKLSKADLIKLIKLMENTQN